MSLGLLETRRRWKNSRKHPDCQHLWLAVRTLHGWWTIQHHLENRRRPWSFFTRLFVLLVSVGQSVSRRTGFVTYMYIYTTDLLLLPGELDLSALKLCLNPYETWSRNQNCLVAVAAWARTYLLREDVSGRFVWQRFWESDNHRQREKLYSWVVDFLYSSTSFLGGGGCGGMNKFWEER